MFYIANTIHVFTPVHNYYIVSNIHNQLYLLVKIQFCVLWCCVGDGNVQLWVFLLELLLSPDHKDVIHWTGQGYEFYVSQPAALARLWGHHRNKPQMTYEKMSRALRYYYSRGIIESVRGRKQTFRFSIDLLQYVTANKDQKSVEYLKSCCQL